MVKAKAKHISTFLIPSIYVTEDIGIGDIIFCNLSKRLFSLLFFSSDSTSWSESVSFFPSSSSVVANVLKQVLIPRVFIKSQMMVILLWSWASISAKLAIKSSTVTYLLICSHERTQLQIESSHNEKAIERSNFDYRIGQNRRLDTYQMVRLPVIL